MKACWGGIQLEGGECLQSQHLEDEKAEVTAQVTLVTSMSQQCSCCLSDKDRGENHPWLEPGRSQGADGNLKLKDTNHCGYSGEIREGFLGRRHQTSR